MQEEQRQIKGTGSRGNFIKSIAIYILFPIAVPAPGSIIVGEFSVAIASVENLIAIFDDKFGTITYFCAIR